MEKTDEKSPPNVALIMGTITDGTHFTAVPTKEGVQITMPGPFGKDISVTLPFQQEVEPKRNLFRNLVAKILKRNK